MDYQSTRNAALRADAARAVLDGLAPDGGLYSMPSLKGLLPDWRGVLELDTRGAAVEILTALLPSFSKEEMRVLVERAYAGKFETEALTPSVRVGDDTVLELFRGPTSAFKDVALSMLPQLMTAAREKCGVTDEILILTATSGDTGKAAMEGFCDVPGTRIIVFYPDGGVSAVQKAQMETQAGKNVCVCAVRGNFDDAQTGVKNVFSAVNEGGLLTGKGVRLSSANSINIGRLAPQVVYYFRAYKDLAESGRIRTGDRVDFVVPTGNFGDILAGYFARELGLPVGRLVCASNANNVLTEFLETGRYDRNRPFYKTSSPSMDILVSSNLERLLFLLSGDTSLVKRLMEQLSREGCYQAPEAVLEKLHECFWQGCCDDAGTKDAIGTVWRKYGYLCDTHTAVAWDVAQQYKAANPAHAPVVILSTASPYKFPAAVLEGLGQRAEGDEFDVMEQVRNVTGVPIPRNLTGLREREVRHRDVIDREQMLEYVLKKASQKEWWK
ncbi:MAG: threonine synthase [Oscillospiraceae bacterium]|nr:threonine synthase [Oscillospiraceae bacterium]